LPWIFKASSGSTPELAVFPMAACSPRESRRVALPVGMSAARLHRELALSGSLRKVNAVAASLPTHRPLSLRFIAISMAGLLVLAFIGWDFFARKPMSPSATVPVAAPPPMATTVVPAQTQTQSPVPSVSEPSAPSVSREGANDF